jgi:hypothetical protein
MQIMPGMELFALVAMAEQDIKPHVVVQLGRAALGVARHGMAALAALVAQLRPAPPAGVAAAQPIVQLWVALAQWVLPLKAAKVATAGESLVQAAQHPTV